MFDLNFAPERTVGIFHALSKIELMSGFNLIGGTALSIQIGHRLSEDLDFWLPSEKMSGSRTDAIVDSLRSAGHQVQLVTPSWKISQAKVNGQDLLALSRDYVVDGVKVTFFARNDAPYLHFFGMQKLQAPDVAFAVMSSEAIFEMKAWLISKRVRARDLFDLMVMVQDHGKSVMDILQAGLRADASYSADYAKDVLVGNVPLDVNDEGFESINLDIRIDDIYDFFNEHVSRYEQTVAKEILARQR